MKRTGCHQEQTRVGVPKATPASSRRTRRTGHIGPLGSNPSQREAAKQNQQWEKVQWGRGWGPGETGPSFQNPVPRTHNGPPETRAPREACHRLRARVLTGGPALQAPLLGTQSSPRVEGVSTDRAWRHREPPSVGVLGALPTPQLLDASPTRGPLGGRQSGPLGGPLSSQNPLKLTSKSNTLSKLYCEDPRYNRTCFFKECMFFKQLF